MKNSVLKDKHVSKLGYLFYSISFLLLLAISFIDTSTYNYIIIIIQSSLSLIIIVLMLNYIEYKVTYIKFIGLAYIIPNILDILGIIFINKQNLKIDMNIISCSLGTILFFMAIKCLIQENLGPEKRSIKYLKSIVSFISIMIFINIYYKVSDNYEIRTIVKMSIYILNLIILVSGMKLLNLNIGNSDSKINNFKTINYLLLIKMGHFIVQIIICNNLFNNRLTCILLDLTSILQIYIVYKIIIKSILIEPYVEILRVNEDIQKSNKEQEDINLLLERVNYIQGKIKEKIIHKDEFFKAVLSSTQNGWIIFDEDLNISYSNESFKKIINHKKGDIYSSIKKNIIGHNKFLSNVSKAKIYKTKIEDLVKTTDNKLYKCIYFNDEINMQLVCLMIDITSESNILSDLITLKKEYENLIRNIKTPILIFDDNDNIVAFSKSYEIVFNECESYITDNEKLDTEKFLETIHEKDVNLVREVMKKNKKAISNEELYNKGLFRFRIINKDKEIVWLESKTNIYYEHDVKYEILSYRDITKYMNNKKYLEKTQDIYKRLLNSIPEGIYLEDIESEEYTFINEKLKDIFNVREMLENKSSKIYRKDIMRIDSDYKHILYNGTEKVKNDKISDYEYIKYIDNDDNIIEAKVASIPFKVGDKILKLSIIKTMEDMKKLEMLKKKIMERDKHDKMKMEFFINMSHELKTPLNLIFTSTQLIESLYIKDKLSGNSIKNHIKLTKQNSYRLLKIINDLIDFTRMESGFYKINMQNKDIVLVIEDIVMSIVEYANNKGVQIIFDTNVEELIMGVDINALEIIILNILSNSIKFTNYGGFVYVDMVNKKSEKKLDIIIKDTGIGIPKDKMNLIFKRFNDVNKEFVGNINGSGIGLSMVRSMSNLIGSKINVESEYGKGSVFTITLDVKEVEVENYIYSNRRIENETLNVEKLIVEMEDIYR